MKSIKKVAARNFSGVPAPRPPPEIQYLQLTKVREVHVDSTSPKYHTARVDRDESVQSVVSVMRKSYAGAVLVLDGADGEFFGFVRGNLVVIAETVGTTCVGIFTTRDLARLLLRKADLSTTPVSGSGRWLFR